MRSGTSPRRTSGSRGTAPSFNRVAYAAAHVVVDPLAATDPHLGVAIDWDATLEFPPLPVGSGLRRGGGDGHRPTRHGSRLAGRAELIRTHPRGGADRPGAWSDAVPEPITWSPATARTLDDVIAAYETQIEAIEALGGRIILMASRALVEVAHGPDDYRRVYGHILRRSATRRPSTGSARCSIPPSQATGVPTTTLRGDG